MDSYGIHWFRRDLRMAGNPGLKWSFKEHSGRVLGIFAFDPVFLSRDDISLDRFAFFLKTLEELKKELVAAGSDLLVLDRGPKEAFQSLKETLEKLSIPLPKTCSFNRDYELFAIDRDAMMSEFMKSNLGIAPHSFRDHLLIEPRENLKDESKNLFYQIYSPFARKWFSKLETPEVLSRIKFQKEGLRYLEKRQNGGDTEKIFNLKWSDFLKKDNSLKDKLAEYIEKTKASIPLPPAGSLEAFKKLKNFEKKIQKYGDSRDIPELDGTSQLSIYLKNGSITTSQIMAELNLAKEANFSDSRGSTKFLKELVWREFYYSILYHRPDVENGPFLEKYSKIKWENSEKLFKAWCEGRTGYPIVDAGMRQLNQTGWMHNRVRMIVASFLTKDLLINWQWGEKYFMKRLLDGDLAPNNGGWQWAASTGCDPQPYFRIFNPILQSKKFDPGGNYIKKYVPELRHLSSEEIHEPRNPVVDHQAQKPKALALYKV